MVFRSAHLCIVEFREQSDRGQNNLIKVQNLLHEHIKKQS